MRLTYILDTFGGGGKERRCLQVIQGLNREGYTDIQVVIVNNDIAYQELYDTTARIDIIDRKNKNLSQVQTAKALYRLLKAFQPDIVQAWGVMSAGVVLMVKPFLKFKFLVAYVADVIPPQGLNKVIHRLCLRSSQKVIGNSQKGLMAYDVPKEKACLIYNGFNETRFHNLIDKESKKKELLIQTPFVVAMVATFWQTKDWQCYIDSAKRLVKQRNDITFLAIGKGPQWDYYNNQIADEERERIMFLGRRDDMDEIYQACDLTVLCSFNGEGVSNSIMESMAWGVPALATNAGGTPEIINDKVNGLLIHHQTPEVVAKMMSDLIDDEPTRSQMGQQAALTIKERFLLQNMTNRYMQLYSELLQ